MVFFEMDLVPYISFVFSKTVVDLTVTDLTIFYCKHCLLSVAIKCDIN